MRHAITGEVVMLIMRCPINVQSGFILKPCDYLKLQLRYQKKSYATKRCQSVKFSKLFKL